MFIRISSVCALLFITGCSGLFLHPDRNDYFPDPTKYIVYEEGDFPSPSGELLHYWLIPAQHAKVLRKDPKGLVTQIHGNAQNLTAHVRNLAFLTEAGYNLAIFDYRGFGRSGLHRQLHAPALSAVPDLFRPLDRHPGVHPAAAEYGSNDDLQRRDRLALAFDHPADLGAGCDHVRTALADHAAGRGVLQPSGRRLSRCLARRRAV